MKILLTGHKGFIGSHYHNLIKENNEVFVVDKNNNNMLIRGIKMSLNDLINTDRLYVAHVSTKEANIENRIFVRKFFSTIGYQILYDTNS
jgi:nucleoside-diphosphate-sugar epimerase